MAIFSGKIDTAYYFNSELSTIAVEWVNSKGERRQYIVPSDPNNSDFQALVEEGWDKQKLALSTAEYRRAQHGRFARLVNEHVKEEVEDIVKKYNIENYQKLYKSGNEMIQAADHTKIWETLEDINENKEDLFTFKMWALDSKWAEKATPDQKKALRRSQTILEGLSVLYLMQ